MILSIRPRITAQPVGGKGVRRAPGLAGDRLVCPVRAQAAAVVGYELPGGLAWATPTFAAVISGGWLVEHRPPTGYIGCNPLLTQADAVRRRHDVTPFDGFYIHIRP